MSTCSMLKEEIKKEMNDAMNNGMIERYMFLQKQYKQYVIDEHIENRDFLRAVSLCDSQEVAEMIVKLAPRAFNDELRELLQNSWTRCDAHKKHRRELLEIFQRVGFVTDKQEKKLKGTLAIYRGNLGEEEPEGISWSLSKEKALWFANSFMSLRWRLVFGVDTSAARPSVWSAKVKSRDVLGYFNERDEQEVVVDPATLTNVRQVETYSFK